MINISSIKIGRNQRKILKALRLQAELRREGWLGRRSLLYVLDVKTSSESCSFGRTVNLLMQEGLIESGTFYEYYLDCLDRDPTKEDREYALEVACENRSKETYYRITYKGMRKYESLSPEKTKPAHLQPKTRPSRPAKKIIAFTPRSLS